MSHEDVYVARSLCVSLYNLSHLAKFVAVLQGSCPFAKIDSAGPKSRVGQKNRAAGAVGGMSKFKKKMAKVPKKAEGLLTEAAAGGLQSQMERIEAEWSARQNQVRQPKIRWRGMGGPRASINQSGVVCTLCVVQVSSSVAALDAKLDLLLTAVSK